MGGKTVKFVHCFLRGGLLVSCALLVSLFSCTPAFPRQLVVGYYPSWLRMTLPASRIQFENLTHIIHAFAWPESSGRIGTYGDLKYPELVAATHSAGRTILIALGGWGQSSGFAPMTADSATRALFVRNLISFCEENGYDGVDLDWEYPANAAERRNLNVLVRELRRAFVAHAKNWLLTMAVPSGAWAGQWFDFDSLRHYVDWFGCMTYDFMGSWVSIATHNSPLYPHPVHTTGSVHEGVSYLTAARGVPRNQILLGIPFYGKGCNATGLFHPNTGGNAEYYYSEIQARIGPDSAYFWDDTCKVPYLLNTARSRFITFDDSLSVRLKCAYAREHELAGVMIWALGQDVVGNQQPLLQAVGRATGLTSAPTMPKTDESSSGLILNNYPNPVNGVTTMRLYSIAQEQVTLAFFDLRGRQVARVTTQKPAGWHRLQLDLKDLPSGVYLYRVSGASLAGTGKMTIMR